MQLCLLSLPQLSLAANGSRIGSSLCCVTQGGQCKQDFSTKSNLHWLSLIVKMSVISQCYYANSSWLHFLGQCDPNRIGSILCCITQGGQCKQDFSIKAHLHWLSLLVKKSAISQSNHATPICLDFLGRHMQIELVLFCHVTQGGIGTGSKVRY
jgi:hypothetical protein